jgi:hypothetical protein
MKNVVAYLRSIGITSSEMFNPVLITDIDGVLVRGNVPIPGTL